MKKSKINLEKKRFQSFVVGLLVSSSFVLLAFSYSTYDITEHKAYVPPISEEALEFQLPPQSLRPQPKMPKKVNLSKTEFKVVPDNHKIILDIDTVTFKISDLWEGTDGSDWNIDTVPEKFIKWKVQRLDWSKIKRTPYFDECENLDRELESQCTYTKIRNHVTNNAEYPDISRMIGAQGTVWVEFVINQDGRVSLVKTLSSPDKNLSIAAQNAVLSIPKMNPGLGKYGPVEVTLKIPVKFLLN